jgi:hypothetical protein
MYVMYDYMYYVYTDVEQLFRMTFGHVQAVYVWYNEVNAYYTIALFRF